MFFFFFFPVKVEINVGTVEPFYRPWAPWRRAKLLIEATGDVWGQLTRTGPVHARHLPHHLPHPHHHQRLLQHLVLAAISESVSPAARANSEPAESVILKLQLKNWRMEMRLFYWSTAYKIYIDISFFCEIGWKCSQRLFRRGLTRTNANFRQLLSCSEQFPHRYAQKPSDIPAHRTGVCLIPSGLFFPLSSDHKIKWDAEIRFLNCWREDTRANYDRWSGSDVRKVFELTTWPATSSQLLAFKETTRTQF